MVKALYAAVTDAAVRRSGRSEESARDAILHPHHLQDQRSVSKKQQRETLAHQEAQDHATRNLLLSEYTHHRLCRDTIVSVFSCARGQHKETSAGLAKKIAD